MPDTTEFYIEDFHALHGFISGMISRDYDITHIFIDSITKIAGENFDEFDGFLCKLESLSNKYNVNFTITVSAPVASATDEIKKYITTELKYNKEMKPQYSNMHDWEFYTSDILTEYQQSVDEGLNIETYKDIFEAVAKLPKDEIKKKFGDIFV